MENTRDIVPRHATRRAKGFALTPLADAMFQLLVFFMLTSSLTPYSLLTVARGASAQTSSPTVAQPNEKAAIWRLSRGFVRAGSTELSLDQLATTMPNLLEAGLDQVVVFSTASASAQDMTSLLEILAGSGITNVQLIASGAR